MRVGVGGAAASLQSRNFRYYLAGAVVSNVGTWIARIAQDWLVLSLTGSSFAVGLTTALQFLPVIAGSLYGGLIADRYPRRRILTYTQVAMAALSAALAADCLAGVVTAWQVYVVVFLLGCVSVFDTPARQAFVTEMVGRDRLQNAVSLDAAAFQSSRLIGPAIAGVLIAGFGAGWAFLLNALSFVGMLGALLAIRDSDLHTTPPRPRARGQIREGLRYVRARPALSVTIGLVAVTGACAYNFQVWLTSFTVTVFDGNAGNLIASVASNGTQVWSCESSWGGACALVTCQRGGHGGFDLQR